MSLINKKHVTERETASYKLDRATVELVRFYSEFIGSPQEHVVNEALLYLFKKDKDFNEWLTIHKKLEASVVAGKPNDSGKLQGRVATPGPTALPAASAGKS